MMLPGVLAIDIGATGGRQNSVFVFAMLALAVLLLLESAAAAVPTTMDAMVAAKPMPKGDLSALSLHHGVSVPTAVRLICCALPCRAAAAGNFTVDGDFPSPKHPKFTCVR